MNKNFYDYDRYSYGEDLDALCYDDGSHSISRRKELNLRKYSGRDTYCGNSEDCEEW